MAISLGYTLTSAWLCTGIRDCPVSWEPYVGTAVVIFVPITIAGIIVAIVGAKLYEIFDTALVEDTAPAESSGTDGYSAR